LHRNFAQAKIQQMVEQEEKDEQIDNELATQTVYGKPKRLYLILGLIYLIGLILFLIGYFC
jgi:hypothetical protein